jgi:hypothetical protein
MIWLTWRQFRAQAIVAAVALAVIAAGLVISGLALAHQYQTAGIAGCHVQHDCQSAARAFLTQSWSGSRFSTVFGLGVAVLLAVPALIGVFWGAPLVAGEIEPGTYRLAWNQSVPAGRWMVVKLSVVGLAAMLTAGILSLMLTWWAEPAFAAAAAAGPSSPGAFQRLAPVYFGAGGIVPIGYAALAFAAGVTAGVLLRRTMPAMALTFGIFAVVQVAWAAWIRPYIIPPVHSILALGAVSFGAIGQSHGKLLLSVGGRAGDWIMASQPVSAAGAAVTRMPAACGTAFNGSQMGSFIGCLARHGVRVAVTYQPDSRYWAFQWLETGIFLLLAAALGWWCVRRIGSRKIA